MREQQQTTDKKNRRRMKGTVVSKSGSKTVVVRVDTRKLHPIYKKRFTVSRKFHAHDETGALEQGQQVLIEEARPMSKMKRWRVLKTV